MYLLDTDICIYTIKNKPAEVLRILQKKSKNYIFVSSITVAELQYGVEKSKSIDKNRVSLLEFLSIFNIISLDDKDAIEFGKIKVKLEKIGKIIGPMDLLISAQAKSKNMILVTNNVKEFERIDGLKIENWAKK
jgi:tRNA(fMet)-specific endonuclease VapC